MNKELKKLEKIIICEKVKWAGKIKDKYSLFELIFLDFIISIKEKNSIYILDIKHKENKFIQELKNKNIKIQQQQYIININLDIKIQFLLKEFIYYKENYKYINLFKEKYEFNLLLVTNSYVIIWYKNDIYICRNLINAVIWEIEDINLRIGMLIIENEIDL